MMSIEFGYAQARAQARHGMRLSATGWRLIEAGDSLAQYLHAARGSSLAPRVEHFAATSSPHAIERSLRRDWRGIVANAARWVPAAWHESVSWTAWLPDLPAIAHLLQDGTVMSWMADDPLLREFALRDLEARRSAIAGSLGGLPHGDADSLDDWWTLRWQALWPAPQSAQGGMHELLQLVVEHRKTLQDDALRPQAAADHVNRLQRRVVRLLRTRLRDPVVVFCHLLLSALEMRRLRNGLIRRALFNDVHPEVGT